MLFVEFVEKSRDEICQTFIWIQTFLCRFGEEKSDNIFFTDKEILLFGLLL